MKLSISIVLSALIVSLAACGGGGNERTPQGGPGGPGGGMMGASASAAVPVQVEVVKRQSISQHLETNGTLEAENEVDIVARTSGPVTAIHVEEGELIRRGELMATIDDREARNQVSIATVARDEAKMAFDRTDSSWAEGLVSREAYDTALSKLDSTTAQLESAQIQLDYTRITAPFDALVVTRSIKLAQHISSGEALFRISDFVPLLCRVEIPEKDLPLIRVGQTAYLRVEAFPDESFAAAVARFRPTVDAATGTFTVTLEVDGRDRLRPGMFASVFLETETRSNAVVIPRSALVLDSLGDTVYVMVDEEATRREVSLGLRDEESVEVLDGLSAGEALIVLGQDGLADGTPVEVLAESGAPSSETAAVAGPPPEVIERIRQRMKDDGLSDEEIEERLEEMKAGGFPPPGGGRRTGGPPPGFEPGSGNLPPRLVERIRNATPEQLEKIKQRMKDFGLTDEQIEKAVASARGESSK